MNGLPRVSLAAGDSAQTQFERSVRLISDLLVWLLTEQINRVHELTVRVETLADNAASIESVVAELQGAYTAITGEIEKLQAAVAAGQDLSQPLADLQAAADKLNGIVPPVTPPADTPPASS